MRKRPAGQAEAPAAASSRGGAAIAAHVGRADGGPAERWFRPRASRLFGGGPRLLEAVSAHRVTASGDAAHWHLVTYGLSELSAKVSDDRRWSGWGFELTIRVAGEDIPYWAVDLLAALAGYVWSRQLPFADGHLVDLRGPIRLDAESALSAAMVVGDPVLGTLDGPYGALEFLQVVGLTAEELELCRAWSVEGVRELLQRRDGLFITDPDRRALTDDDRLRSEIAERRRVEGSSMHELRVGTLRLDRRRQDGADVTLGAGASAALGPALRRELLGRGAAFDVLGEGARLRFSLGDAPELAWRGERALEVVITPGSLEATADLFDGRPGWGRRPEWPTLRFHVVP